MAVEVCLEHPRIAAASIISEFKSSRRRDSLARVRVVPSIRTIEETGFLVALEQDGREVGGVALFRLPFRDFVR
jgi:hypothetical protein